MKKILIPLIMALASASAAMAQKQIAYIYGDVSEYGISPSSADPNYPIYDQMRLTDTGATGCSDFRDIMINSGYQVTEHYDANTTFDAAFFNSYDVVIFGLHQELLTNAEKNAMDAWINAGGSILVYNDSAAGGKFNVTPLGAQNLTGQTAVNNLISNFGMLVMIDQGGSNGGVPILQSGTASSHPVITENLVIKGEGVSPLVIDASDPNYDDFEILIPYTSDPNFLLSGVAKLDYGNGLGGVNGTQIPNGIAAANREYAALVVKEVGAGHVMGIFDRQPFWNNGNGANINDEKNALILENIVKFLAGDLGGNSAPVVSALANRLVTTTGEAFLDGSISGTSTSRSWSVVSGSGQVTFDNATATDTTATFSAAGIYELAFTASNGSASNSASVVIEVVDPSSVVAAVDCGRTSGAYNAQSGISYTTDNYFVGGVIDTPLQNVSLTIDDPIYKRARSQMTSYNIPVANGDYLVLLQYAETFFTAQNKRVFDVLLEGSVVSNDLDIWAKNSSRYAAYDELVATSVNDGTLNISFNNIINNAVVSGIVVVPMTMATTRIEMEDYDAGGFLDFTAGNTGGLYRTDNVDIGSHGPGEYFVGWIQVNEWLEYTVNAPATQDYTFTFSVATSFTTTRRFQVFVDGVNVSGNVNFTYTGGWNQFQDVVVPNIPLSEGNQTIRILMKRKSFNMDYFEITP